MTPNVEESDITSLHTQLNGMRNLRKWREVYNE